MARTPEEIREQTRLRQQRKRERDKASKEAAKSKQAEQDEFLKNHADNAAWAREQDAQGTFYKSECRPMMELLAIYEGTDVALKEYETDEEEEEAEAESKTKKEKKEKKDEKVRPNPSREAITFRAITLDDNGITVKIDPNEWEYETLSGQKVNLKTLYEVNEVVPFRRWLDLRDKARKNLFWLCNLVGRSMFHKSHQMICDMFVHKNFDDLYFPGFVELDLEGMIDQQKRVAADGTPTKTLMVFAPRSGRKSTIDGVDAVQWMLNCPDIRILIVTAFKELASQLFGEIKRYFFRPEGAQATAFQLVFPEYTLYGRAGKSASELRCPAAIFVRKEPNVKKTSLESSVTGQRCDIRKLDDAVDPKNSTNDELRTNLKAKIDATTDLVEAWGFTDVIGTRWFTTDWYGTRMSKDEEGNEPEPYAYLSISAWTPKPQFETLYKQLLTEPNGMFKVTEEMVDLWFPYKLSFKQLRTLLRTKKEVSFKNQQLNIPTDPKTSDLYINQFDEMTLRSHSYDRTAAPKAMEIIQCWDVAYSEQGRTSDYSVGVTLGIYLNARKEYCVVVLEVFFDKWKASELASNVIKYYEKHRPKVVYMENANGVNFLKENLINYARLRGSDFMQNFRTRPVSNKPNAKRERIKDLEFLLGHDRLWFVNGAWIEETWKQLTEYRGGKSTAYRKDDIPDALSLAVVSHLPSSALKHNPDPKDVERENEERVAKSKKEAAYNRMFGSPSPTRPAPIAPVESAAPPPRDPRQELMKKLVGKILPLGIRY
jgi:predicted phage terminase large subunit-like protein